MKKADIAALGVGAEVYVVGHYKRALVTPAEDWRKYLETVGPLHRAKVAVLDHPIGWWRTQRPLGTKIEWIDTPDMNWHRDTDKPNREIIAAVGDPVADEVYARQQEQRAEKESIEVERKRAYLFLSRSPLTAQLIAGRKAHSLLKPIPIEAVAKVVAVLEGSTEALEATDVAGFEQARDEIENRGWESFYARLNLK